MTLNIVIGIPTVGRAPILRETLRALALQTRPADRVLVCGTKEGDGRMPGTALAGLSGSPMGQPHSLLMGLAVVFAVISMMAAVVIWRWQADARKRARE